MWPNPNYHFEFSQAPFAWQKVRWPGLLLLVVCIVLVLTAWQTDDDANAQLLAMAQRKAQLVQANDAASQLQKIVVTPVAPARNPEEAKQHAHAAAQKKAAVALTQAQEKEAETITQQLNIRWFDLLQALEARQIRDIALLQLLPDATRGQFTLSGEAKDYNTLLKYVGHLQEATVLTQVHLQKHQVIETHPQRPVSFEIQGGWQP
ncbi:MAG: PilN domain-containing protein [Methylophilus sp.]|uniref:PilN domain-containing protein n=1 Tax=Methylophilus sp. TaxID=29541 RepID=UPI003FA01927